MKEVDEKKKNRRRYERKCVITMYEVKCKRFVTKVLPIIKEEHSPYEKHYQMQYKSIHLICYLRAPTTKTEMPNPEECTKKEK